MANPEEKIAQLPPATRKEISDIIDRTGRDALIRICRANNVIYAAIFGSVARGTAKVGSDLDILVKFSSRKSLIDLIRIEGEITEALGRKTDLVTENSLSPYIRSSIQSELVVLYAEG